MHFGKVVVVHQIVDFQLLSVLINNFLLLHKGLNGIGLKNRWILTNDVLREFEAHDTQIDWWPGFDFCKHWFKYVDFFYQPVDKVSIWL